MLNTVLNFVVILLGVSCPQSASEDFTDSFKLLNSQLAKDVGREAKVRGYEQLLKEFPDDPRCAKVMLQLSSHWEHTIPSIGVVPDYEKSIEWLRKAASVAKKGSDDWEHAQFYLAGRLRRETPKEAREILKEINKHATSNFTKIKVLYEQQMMEARAGDLDKAEEICLRIQRWLDDPSHVPERTFDLGKIYLIQQSSASSMMASRLNSNQPAEERLKKFEKIVAARGTQFNCELLKKMRDRLGGLKEPMRQIEKNAPF